MPPSRRCANARFNIRQMSTAGRKTRQVENASSPHSEGEGYSHPPPASTRGVPMAGKALSRCREAFQSTQYPTKAQRQALAAELHLPLRKVTVWFGNQRQNLSRAARLATPLSEESGTTTPSADNGDSITRATSSSPVTNGGISLSSHTPLEMEVAEFLTMLRDGMA